MQKLVVVPLALSLALGCRSSKEHSAAPQRILAKVDDHVITLDDLERQIERQPPAMRARYAAPEMRKQLLDNLVRFEVMFREAEKRGYDKDPDVQRSLKQQMVNQLVQREFEARLRPGDVPEAEARKYYESHPLDYNRPEEVRVSQIVVKDKASATRALAEAKALAPGDAAAFRQVVGKYSVDETSRLRGGELPPFDRQTTLQPKALVEAAFALNAPASLSPVVQTDQGFHILRLVQKRPALTRSFDDAKPEIQRRLLQEGRQQRIETWANEMRAQQKVVVFEDRLKEVKIGETPSSFSLKKKPDPPAAQN
jgi:peptidyl-prolyl cis-trans isomerase C